MKNTQENRLRIEMVHDIVCSWCPIGFRNIQAAIKALRNLRLSHLFSVLSEKVSHKALL
ncbi:MULTISPECIES: hypothetical protein [unclassified Marinomonas]|uniref:hypothetical protein n=1 Tax=unclassified Marinomonas TaxID=196814 RepID=UPI000ABF6053|nr:MULTISPECIES: hypothetical protein [unclassified Marinomonas]